MIITATRGRPQNFMRMIDAFDKTECIEPWILLMDSDDPKLAEYHHIRDVHAPEVFIQVYESELASQGGISSLFNQFFDENPALEYYAMIADDVVPETYGWAKRLKDACMPDKIAFGDDGIQHHRLPTHPFIGGDLARRWGCLAPRELKHMYVDNWWKDMGIKDKCLLYLENVYLTHYHYINKKAKKDESYQRSEKFMQEDGEAYRNMRKGPEVNVLDKWGWTDR